MSELKLVINDWRSVAGCKGVNSDVFFPKEDSFSASRAAKAICAVCR
jgi:hypothetical protein